VNSAFDKFSLTSSVKIQLDMKIKLKLSFLFTRQLCSSNMVSNWANHFRFSTHMEFVSGANEHVFSVCSRKTWV
jgi:hypothetical protein